MPREPWCGKSGQALVEILVGLSLLALSLSFGTILVFGGQNISIEREQSIQARMLAKEGIDAARSIKNRSWGSLTNGAKGLIFSVGQWQWSGSSDTKGIFTRKIIISDAGNDTKKIESEVTWNSSSNRPQNVRLVTLLTNWKNALAFPDPGDTGGAGLDGDWENPESLGSLDLGAGNQATDIDVSNKIIYISTQASSKSKPDVHAVDATNPSLPVLRSSVDVDANGVVSIENSGGYTYGASIGVIPDLKVVNSSNPNSLSLAAEFNVITFVDATAIFKSGSTIYLGVQKTSFNGELFSINVSDPLHPAQTGVFEANAAIGDISIKGNLAFVATSRDDAELMILNISNPASMQQLGVLDISGTADGTSVFIQNQDTVFLGVGTKLYIVDATNTAAPTIRGNIEIGGTVNDIYVQETLAFLATSNSTSEFQAINVANPSAPVLHSSLNFPQVGTGIDYEDNIIYMSVRSNDGLRIITSQ